ncbi:MAG: SdrD B-like domain-containing protein [Planctomycetota bacterium]
MLALIGVAPLLENPIIAYDNGGTAAYDSSTDLFEINATPIGYTADAGSGIFFGGTVDLDILVDDSGNLIGGVADNDFVLTGSLDTNIDFIPDFTGDLLTAEITQFGFQENGVIDEFDFVLSITGGALASFYVGRDLGITLQLENSSFNDDFAVDFSGGPAKGNIGGLQPAGNPAEPGIAIEKSTNGQDADAETGPLIAVGDTADFEYVVTNTGNVPLASVTVTDDEGVVVTFQNGDSNNNGLLDLDESWVYSGSTTVVAGQYTNLGLVTGLDSTGEVAEPVSDSDPSNHFGVAIGIDIEKATNGDDADIAPGPTVLVGDNVAFEYVVTNTGNVPVSNVTVIDDQGVFVTFESGDANNDGRLDVDETWIYTGSTIATAGLYTNIGSVSGFDSTGTITDAATDSDPSNHTGVVAEIDVMKFVDVTTITEQMVVVDFEGLAPGTIVADQFPGVTVEAENRRHPTAGNRAMIFDSSNPTGNDYDLGTPNQAFGGPGVGAGGGLGSDNPNEVGLGNILIISEDGDSSDPDDEAQGGVFKFTFDSPVRVDHLELLDIDSNESGGSVVTMTTPSGQHTFSIPSVGNNSFQRIDVGVEDVLSMTVDFVSSGAITELKFTEFSETKEWFDANTGPGPSFETGEAVEFSYKVTNPGDVAISNVQLSDDNATPGVPQDDFAPTFVSGDINGNSELDPGEEWIYEASIIAVATGQFTNTGEVLGDVVGFADATVSDDDPANYSVVGLPAIDIEKFTNGVDADDPNGDVPEVAPGGTVTWTYEVTNTGQTPFGHSEVTVTDDNGTPTDTSDDFEPAFVPSSDVGGDGILSPGETWIYSASDVAEQLGESTGESTRFRLTGNSALDGTNGNIRSFVSEGITVNASAFSRSSSGSWEEAFLGAFSSGLGVTDVSEGNGGNGTHRVDNVGKLNYVLFEFSESVVVDRVFLDSVVHDSDISVWVGSINDAFTNHVTLSDSILSELEEETNNTRSSRSRWANVNADEVVGNVLVVAASVKDHTPEDRFKIKKLKIQKVDPGIYSNLATVLADTVTDSDPSHYRNPTLTDSGKIGNFVWEDVNMNGRQDAGEAGIEGVEVTLLDAGGNPIDSTTTDAGGMYLFSELPAGDYRVKFSAPDGFVFSPQFQGSDPDNGSNADPHTGITNSIWLDPHEIDNTIDAGLYESAVDVMFEAEDFDHAESPWRVFHSSEASEGRLIKAPNGTGSHYNHVPNGESAKYTFSVGESGAYEISGLVKAVNGRDNSVWVRVNQQGWVQWHMDIATSFEWQTVTDGFDQQSMTFDLTQGQNQLEIRVREDGTKLDKFMVSRVQYSTVIISANDYVAGGGDWIVDHDEDGNEFLVAGGNHYQAPDVGDVLTYQFDIAEAGAYHVFGHVSASNSVENSFWVRIDGGDWVEWHLTVTGDGNWEWQTVTQGHSQAPVTFDLTEGSHTLEVAIRESGTELDLWAVTTDANFDG